MSGLAQLMETSVKKTALFELEKNLKAHFVEFAGWQLPLYYEGILKEHQAVRQKAGLFDVSHMGKIKISGLQAGEFLSKVTANDPRQLKPGHIQYTMFLNEAGGVKDDALLYRFEKYFFLVVNAANTPKILEWLKLNNSEKVIIEDVTENLAILALQGPFSEKIILEIFGPVIFKIFYYNFLETGFQGQKLFISRTGYTGEDGFEVFCEPDSTPELWKLLVEKGGAAGLVPCGLGSRDLLRIEAALPLFGHELSEEISPLEAGFEWVVKFKKTQFIGHDALLKQKQAGLLRKLSGLIIEDKLIPRQNYQIFDETGQTLIGQVTSGTFSPALGLPVAMAFLEPPKIVLGQLVKVFFKDRLYAGRVVELPFYRHRTKKFKEVK